MSSALSGNLSGNLSGVPAASRRRFAAVTGLLALVFLAVGILALTDGPPIIVEVLAAVALAAGVGLALVAWGLVRSVRLEQRTADLDERIEATVRAFGGQLCDCGHEHDPTELHVTGDPCEHDGAGHECSHTCDTCVLQTLRR